MAQDTKSAQQTKGIQIGSKAPLFTATNLNDEKIALQDLLQKGPVVIIFYRGQWCPICNRHLQSLQDSLQLIYNKGAQVIAISPEKSEFLKKTAEKTNAKFELLYDEGYKIAKAYDVLFKPEFMSRTIYNTFLGANLKNAHSDDSQQLPVPATYIVGQDGKVIWRHFDPDYKKRSSVKDIVANLP